MKTIEEIYVEKLCIECKNKNNNEDLCDIRRKIDNTVSCYNYSRCMKTKCKDCKKEKECFVTAKKHKPSKKWNMEC